MLVFRRRIGEKVILQAGEYRIEIEVLDSSAGAARLGLTAPAAVLIDREEVFDRKAQEEDT